ncbi:AMP-binding protein [Saccharopolyspora sp. ID03-671]|uniref:class I adenylate-forming enzyme family protein n=1 Tax=Saccharopolyspora sp. ID03-671 TaxID=3073066 RepID=UPI00324EE333
MLPHDMGVLFEQASARGRTTTIHLDRPFDIAPETGLRHDVTALAELVRAASGWWVAAGARPGGRVAILKDDHWDVDLLACAAIRAGAVPAKLSPHLSAETASALLKRLEPDVLVTSPRVLGRGVAEGVDLASFARTTVSTAPAPGTVSLDELRGSAPPEPQRRDDDAPLIITHSSGTTGVPKLVVHSTRTIIGNLARFEALPTPVVGLRRDDVVATASAYAHGRTFSWTAATIAAAPAEIVVLTSQDPDRVDPLLREHPPTVLEGLPSAFVRFKPLTTRLANPFRRVRLFISTYDAVHPPTLRAYLRASGRKHPVWLDGWGQTETGPLTFRLHHRSSVQRRRARAHPAGRPVPVKTRLRVVDPATFHPVRPGESGLVLARTRALCLDYLGETERYATKKRGRWWNTGDLAIRGRDGSVHLVDREVDCVAEGSCLATEDTLEERLPHALECVLLARAEHPPLPVVVTADGTLSEHAWRHACHGLPEMADPVTLTWDDVPRTGTGKVRRLALLDRLTGSTDTYGTGRWT